MLQILRQIKFKCLPYSSQLVTDRQLWLGDLAIIEGVDVMLLNGTGMAHFLAMGCAGGAMHYYVTESATPPLDGDWNCENCNNVITTA